MGRSIVNDPLQKYNYKVSIPGLPTGIGFTKVSGLSRELEVTEYEESGYKYTAKLSGREKVGNITLERGMFASKDLENLYKKTLSNPQNRQTITITVYDKLGGIARVWNLAEAWVSKWEGSDLDASSSDVGDEKITIEFEYFL